MKGLNATEPLAFTQLISGYGDFTSLKKMMHTQGQRVLFSVTEFSRNGTKGAWLLGLQMVLPMAVGLFSPKPQEQNDKPIPSRSPGSNWHYFPHQMLLV